MEPGFAPLQPGTSRRPRVPLLARVAGVAARAGALVAACALLPGAIAPAYADAGVVLMGGLRAGSGFESASSGSSGSVGDELRLRSGAAGSLALEWPLDGQRLVQALVSHQRTQLALGPAASPGTAAQMPLRVTHLHVGGVNYFDGPVGAGPYVIGGLGLTQMTPGLPGTSSRTRASLNVGVGHEWAPARSLSLRAELRAYVVAIGSEGAFFCSGGCTVAIRANTLTQVEAAVGVRFAF